MLGCNWKVFLQDQWIFLPSLGVLVSLDKGEFHDRYSKASGNSGWLILGALFIF